MEQASGFLLAVASLLLGLLAAGGGQPVVAAVAMLGAAGLIFLTGVSHTRADPDESDDGRAGGSCAACGRRVPPGRERCEDCAAVGSWRK